MGVPSVQEMLRGENNILLATVETNQPRVRPVTMVEHKGEFFVLTGMSNAKILQIKKNPKVEVLRLVPFENQTGYIRFSAIAKIIEDSKIRKRIANASTFFFDYWDSPENPNYALLCLIPQKIEYLKPGQMIPEPVTKVEFTQ